MPIENSREGGVGATLDALVFDAPDVEIVGELVHRVTYCLAAAEPIAPDEVRTVHSHPQATGQCARFLAEQLPGAAIVAAASTADAMRAVAQEEPLPGAPPHAAIGSRHAATLYGATLLAEGDRGRRGERDPLRLARRRRRRALGARVGSAAAPSAPAPAAPRARAAPRRALAPRPRPRSCSGAAATSPPAGSSTCLTEFSSRSINLTRIESRPRRVGLGHYMFFCDLEGAASSPDVAAAIAGLRGHCEAVRVLGSFPAAG